MQAWNRASLFYDICEAPCQNESFFDFAASVDPDKLRSYMDRKGPKLLTRFIKNASPTKYMLQTV